MHIATSTQIEYQIKKWKSVFCSLLMQIKIVGVLASNFQCVCICSTKVIKIEKTKQKKTEFILLQAQERLDKFSTVHRYFQINMYFMCGLIYFLHYCYPYHSWHLTRYDWLTRTDAHLLHKCILQGQMVSSIY